MRRVPQKRDASEAAIVEALRKCGWSVQQISAKDAPDLLLGLAGVTYLAEVKTGNGKLREGQARWHQAWEGHPVFILRTVEEALRLRDRLETGPQEDY